MAPKQVKHWIFMKCGLSRDPKHRAQMGECIWLYMRMIDRADWETGVVYDWKDGDEAIAMGMGVDTLRRQRQKMESLGYINCVQKQHSQDIYIMNWHNPRAYDQGVINPRPSMDDPNDQGGNETPPSDDDQGGNQGSDETPPSEVEGLNQGLNQGSRQVKTPTSSSISNIILEADKTMDAILQNERVFMEKFKLGKAWKGRDAFTNNEMTLFFADLCAKKFGAPSKKDTSLWLQEIGIWVDHGCRPSDWDHAMEIVKGYTTPAMSPTGITKAIKTAASERRERENKQQNQPSSGFPQFQDGKVVLS